MDRGIHKLRAVWNFLSSGLLFCLLVHFWHNDLDMTRENT